HLFLAVLAINTALWGADALILRHYTGVSRQAKERELREDLALMREMINQYAADHNRFPRRLDDLVGAAYLDAIPVDPMTGSRSTWVPIVEQESQWLRL